MSLAAALHLQPREVLGDALQAPALRDEVRAILLGEIVEVQHSVFDEAPREPMRTRPSRKVAAVVARRLVVAGLPGLRAADRIPSNAEEAVEQLVATTGFGGTSSRGRSSPTTNSAH